ncbi:MAG: zinc-ribbon domain-containing protein, partial [Pseudomonadota bacterium]|nr:zinc-ribbon domain-containing protein [Pseudomonadota bacterium]
MILTCPACSTQYRLKDGAIPPEGRQVRCAACKHKWHEDGAPAEGERATATTTHGEEAAGQWPVTNPQAAQNVDGGIAGGPPQPDFRQVEQATATVP